jgi:phosphoribosylformylglycinamidine synthase subunit PurQ / glutaminase
MRSAVVVFPGSNRDVDVQNALTQISGRAPALVWHRDSEIPAVDLIVVPGGFSYGDYLRCGAIAAHSPAMREVKARADKGVAVLGICNGFQILIEAGMLPGALLRNAHLKFACRDVHLRVETSQSPFTCGYETGEVIRVPVAHHDGNYFADPATRSRLADRGQIAFRYCNAEGVSGEEANPNGSLDGIAGIFNESKTVLGLMPHPEDAVDPATGSTGGRGLFAGLVGALT